MAHFMAVIQGNRGEASRLGSANSGMQASVNGWHSGVRVYASYNEEKGRDEFQITLSGGSNGYIVPRPLGVFALVDGEMKKLEGGE